MVKSNAVAHEGENRRTSRRYPLCLDLQYRLMRRGQIADSGAGHTVNFSTGGVLINCEHPLPVGIPIELHVAWPACLENGVALKLHLEGRTVRIQGNLTAVAVHRHEFLVRATPAATATAAAGSHVNWVVQFLDLGGPTHRT